MTEDTWGQVQDELLKSVGLNNYKNWIEPLEFKNLKTGLRPLLFPRFSWETGFHAILASRFNII